MNNLSFFIVAIFCVIIGAIVSWIIRKLLFEKNYTSASHLCEINEKLQNMLTEKAIVDERYNATIVQKEIVQNKLSEIETKHADLIRDNSKKMGIEESLVNEKERLVAEMSQLKSNLKDKTEEVNKALVSIADKDAKIKYQEEKRVEQKRELDEMGEKLKKDFPAYLVALRKDPELWYYAYSKKIILVCPSNLMAVLKITSDLWKREYQNQNAMEIAKRGGQLYDKFVGFVNTMQELGGTITKAQSTYNKAFGQLATGSGNLVRQAELMRKLEIKATKKLPEQIINEAIDVEIILPDDENNAPVSLN